ncbi:ArsC/Spx/MgsR family protein [Dokdonia sp.]|uniref:ArsC/Spx/MgsR family protein n=1 Tax=Dokdonia sp. TaxID=2024995 RepID=UPI003264C0BE
MFIIYYDPGCLYSIACLAVLKSRKVSFKKIEYLKEPLTIEILKGLVKKLKINPIDLIRKDQSDWKDHYGTLDLTDEEVYHLLMRNAGLMMRPIIVNGNKAVIGRPPKVLVGFVSEFENL